MKCGDGIQINTGSRHIQNDVAAKTVSECTGLGTVNGLMTSENFQPGLETCMHQSLVLQHFHHEAIT